MGEHEAARLWIKKAMLASARSDLVWNCAHLDLWCPSVSDPGVPGAVGRQIVHFLLQESDLFLQTAGDGDRTLG